jgi:hypothetical protein
MRVPIGPRGSRQRWRSSPDGGLAGAASRPRPRRLSPRLTQEHLDDRVAAHARDRLVRRPYRSVAAARPASRPASRLGASVVPAHWLIVGREVDARARDLLGTEVDDGAVVVRAGMVSSARSTTSAATAARRS